MRLVGQDVVVPARGRVPKWCSATCRHRAWEQTRNAASGRAAVEVIDRQIETVKTVTVVQHHTREVPVLMRPNTVAGFVEIAGGGEAGPRVSSPRRNGRRGASAMST